MTDYLRSETYSSYSVSSGRYRAPADIADGPLSGMSSVGQNAANVIRDIREREKKEMAELNDRLASYLEKVCYMEHRNRCLISALEQLKTQKTAESVSVMYKAQESTTRSAIQEANSQSDALEREIRRFAGELGEHLKKYDDAIAARDMSRKEADDLLMKLANIEARVNNTKRQSTYLAEEVARIRRENQNLANQVARIRGVVDEESQLKSGVERELNILLEECQMLSNSHFQELQTLVEKTHRDTTPENRELFKNQLAADIQTIRAQYEQNSQRDHDAIKSKYQSLIAEIRPMPNGNDEAREQAKKLRGELLKLRLHLKDVEGVNASLRRHIELINSQLEEDQRHFEMTLGERDANTRLMRDECQALMVEIQMLLDIKQNLDNEITLYRKMLEGEENRAGHREFIKAYYV